MKPKGEYKKEISWDEATTLEDWVRRMVESGKNSEVLAILQNLPEDKKKRFREIWIEIRNRR